MLRCEYQRGRPAGAKKARVSMVKSYFDSARMKTNLVYPRSLRLDGGVLIWERLEWPGKAHERQGTGDSWKNAVSFE
jgi:hypothetical protein